MAPLRSGFRRSLFACAALMSALGSVSGLAAQQPRANEYEVKAAYLYNFGRFVAWPSTATTGSDFVVCVLGADPFGQILDKTVAGARVQDKPVAVRRIPKYEADTRCHILFIGASEEEHLAAILATIGNAPVLTVGETPGFAEHGGMLGFSVEGNRVRFAINMAVAQAAGLVPSSELLRVATTVLPAARSGD